VCKAVIDTSVFVSGVFSKRRESASYQIIQDWRQGRFNLVISPQIVSEYYLVFLRRGLSDSDTDDLIRAIQSRAFHVSGDYQTSKLDNVDPKDNMLLATAYESKADYLVSLCKKHILPIKYWHGTQIVTPPLFLKQLTQIEFKKNLANSLDIEASETTATKASVQP
jgi:putative PIN family toxin of toxin-antitoxin system